MSYRFCSQGNCLTRHSGGNLVQLAIVPGPAGLDSTCARFSTISYFLLQLQKNWTFVTNFNFSILLLRSQQLNPHQANDHAAICPNYRPPDALDWLRRLGGPGQLDQEEEDEDVVQEQKVHCVSAEARGKGLPHHCWNHLILHLQGRVHHLSHSTCGNRPTSTSPKSTFIPSNLPQARSAASSVPKSFGGTRSPNTWPLFTRPLCLDSARTGCK